MTTPRAQALEILAALFDEDPPEDETPEQIAVVVLDRLRENGILVAPIEPTREIKVVLRRAVYENTRGAGDTPAIRAPAKVWAKIIETLTKETEHGA